MLPSAYTVSQDRIFQLPTTGGAELDDEVAHAVISSDNATMMCTRNISFFMAKVPFVCSGNGFDVRLLLARPKVGSDDA